jgi:hypothetical protein
MTCDTVQPMIEEYFDGELDATARRTVEAHLAACPACAAELASLEREHSLFAQYDRGFEPSPEMWSAVRSRIEAEAGKRGSAEGWFRSLTSWLGGLIAPSQLVPVGIGALAVVFLVAMGIVWRNTTEAPQVAEENRPVEPMIPPSPLRPEPPVPPTVQPDPAPPVTPKPGPAIRRPKPSVERDQQLALPASVVDAERRYLQAIALLTKDIERSSVGVDAGARDDWNKPLEALDRNIDAARRAVRKNPDDPTAVLSMLSAYDSKVETLQTMALLQAANDR